jgi:hypothetical protein
MLDYQKPYQKFVETYIKNGVDIEAAKTTLKKQHIETPLWGYGKMGTRFKVFTSPVDARNVYEKVDGVSLQAPATALFDSLASYFNLIISLIFFTVNRSWAMTTSLFLKGIACHILGLTSAFLSPPSTEKCATCSGISVRHAPESLCDMERILQFPLFLEKDDITSSVRSTSLHCFSTLTK